MATKLLVFLSLLVFQAMATMLGEAAMCEAPSRLFRGLCFSDSNCGSICEKDGFTNGHCNFAKCICAKACGAGGGSSGGMGPPGEGMPGGGEEPPEEGPPGSGGEEPPEEGGGGGEGQLRKAAAGGRKMMPVLDNKF